jgi:hypothetical protein
MVIFSCQTFSISKTLLCSFPFPRSLFFFIIVGLACHDRNSSSQSSFTTEQLWQILHDLQLLTLKMEDAGVVKQTTKLLY